MSKPEVEKDEKTKRAEARAARKAAIDSKRAERKEEASEDEQDQYLTDLEAINDLEALHGDSNVSFLRVPYSPGLPVLIACRTPKTPEIKRYRSRIKPGEHDTMVAAAQEIGSVCRIYPRDQETWDKLLAARPGIDVQLGTACIALGAASKDTEGKGATS